jgi:GNAT superfamily N-acetyltransferase
VVLEPAARGKGLGQQLLAEAVAHCLQLWPAAPIMLSAQTSAQGCTSASALSRCHRPMTMAASCMWTCGAARSVTEPARPLPPAARTGLSSRCRP